MAGEEGGGWGRDMSKPRPDKDTLQKNAFNAVWLALEGAGGDLDRGKLCRTFSNCPHLTRKDTRRRDKGRQKRDLPCHLMSLALIPTLRR